MTTINKSKALSLAIKKIEFAFGISDASNPSAERKLMCAIVTQSVRDLYAPACGAITGLDKCSAMSYLNGDMSHAESCGVNGDYVRRILRGFGFDVSAAKAYGAGVLAPIDEAKWRV